MPGVILMENAGARSAEIIDAVAPEGLIAILCGGGNNGGDGYVIARHLQRMQRKVEIISLTDTTALEGDAKINFDIVSRASIPIQLIASREQLTDALDRASTIIDAMLGTGAKGAPRGLIADAITIANSKPALKVALDLPSGLDCDSGIANQPTFIAEQTVTFVAEKIGFKKNNADKFVGVVSIIDIGVPQKLLDDLFVSSNGGR